MKAILFYWFQPDSMPKSFRWGVGSGSVPPDRRAPIPLPLRVGVQIKGG